MFQFTICSQFVHNLFDLFTTYSQFVRFVHKLFTKYLHFIHKMCYICSQFDVIILLVRRGSQASSQLDRKEVVDVRSTEVGINWRFYYADTEEDARLYKEEITGYPIKYPWEIEKERDGRYSFSIHL